jgi:PKD repeat protein
MSRCAGVLGAAIVLLLVVASSAGAASPVYGVVSRVGGYEAEVPQVAPTEAKFVLPVGFAVDPKDASAPGENAIYVLDRTVKKLGKGELQYRLQKLSSTGAVLGTAILPPEKFSETSVEEEIFAGAYPLISLAVDSEKHRVYALVESMVNSGGGKYVAAVQRLVAWSTVPVAGKLEAASGYPVDPVTDAGLVAGSSTGAASELEPAAVGNDLIAPEGLAVASNHDVVIEAQHGVAEGPIGGPTMLQQVVTEGLSSGKLGGSWLASTAKGPNQEPIAPFEEQGDGVFTANDGSFGIDLYEWERANQISRLADVSSELDSATLIAPDRSGGKDKDGAASLDIPSTVNDDGETSLQYGASPFTPAGAGSPFVQLSEGAYAARFGEKFDVADLQGEIEPWDSGGIPPLFWSQGSGSTPANMGVRLFNAGGEVLTTIGGDPACDLDTSQFSLAAGADGSLFVLTQPEETSGSGDQVIEFAPGKGAACAQPSGRPKVVEGGEESGSTVIAHEGQAIKLDASAIERAGGSPYEFDWNFGDSTGGGTLGEGYELGAKMQAPEFKWPTPLESHTYAKAGIYKADVRMIGDYGTDVFPFEVKVLSSKAPTAAFTTPTAIVAGQAAMFEGASSTAEAPIIDYHWEFGDGGEAEAEKASHVFVTPGHYKVTLEITDEVGETASVTHEVTVAAASGGGSGGGGGGTSGGGGTATGGSGATGTATTTTTGSAATIGGGQVKAATTSKPQTRAQRLAAALKACQRQPKKRRASCELRAKKRYGPPAKKQKKTGKKKK